MIILFLLFPFLAFLLSCRNLKSKINGLIFVLFAALFGYSSSFDLKSADSFRIGWSFCNVFDRKLSFIVSSYEEGSVADIYASLVMSIVKQFTENPKFLFLMFGLIFGWLCFLSIKLVIRERIGSNNVYFSILMICFFSLFSFLDIHGVRFGTALWLFFLSATNFIVYNRRKYVVGVILSMFIHFSFFPIVLLTIFFKYFIYKESGYNVRFYMTFFYISFLLYFILPMLSLESIVYHMIPIKGGLMEAKVNAYTITEEGVGLSNHTSFYRAANNLFTNVYQYIMQFSALLIFYKIYKSKVIISISTRHLLIFCLVLYTLSNCLHGLIQDGTGIRYIWLSWMFLLFLLYRIYNFNRILYWKRIILCLPVIFLYKISYMIINSVRMTEVILWFMNLPYIIYDGLGFTITYGEFFS